MPTTLAPTAAPKTPPVINAPAPTPTQMPSAVAISATPSRQPVAGCFATVVTPLTTGLVNELGATSRAPPQSAHTVAGGWTSRHVTQHTRAIAGEDTATTARATSRAALARGRGSDRRA